MDTNTRRDRIRELNDNARRLLIGARVYVTRGIAALPVDDQALIFSRVCSFNQFTPENDPYGEHDFGAFDHNGVHIFWKIDCLYEESEVKGADGQPAITRVLTIMLADEW